MYRRLRCGGTYDSNELTRTLQYRGEYQGTAAYETERAVLPAGTMWSIAESGAMTGRIMTNCYNQGENGQEGGEYTRKEEGA